jgi:hypothetical protein
LTDRELKVPWLFAAGRSNQRIARDLVVPLDKISRSACTAGSSRATAGAAGE